ncbi:MAG TPA: peptidylprolyl isomerase [Chitinophagaceae bacterium]|nr:peptidylprolyl isomerase [Chitinophagaceae bacterium]
MSVIQQIQEKYAKLMAVIIAIALMTFVVMLAFENGGSLFGGNSTTVGKVNGKTIDYNDFIRKVDRQEKNMEARGYGSGAQLQQQAIEATWSDEVNTIIEESEYDKLGIKVGKKEMGDVLYGPNAPEDLKKIFTDSNGVYNGQMAKQQIDATIKIKKGTPEQLEQREQLVAFINYQETARYREKYNSLLSGSVNYPKWFVEKQIAENSQIAKISLVRANYSENTDTTIKVTDKEIDDYVSKHKNDYKQEESRSIVYVPFSAAPGKADTAIAMERVLALKPEFDTVKNVVKFLAAQGVTTFTDSYFKGTTIQIPVKDSIFKLPINGVYGPYLDGGSYSLAKLLGIRQEPEIVRVRHILIATGQRDPQTGQMIPTKDTISARKLADSIQTAIANGTKFDSLCIKFSEDNPTAEAPNSGQFKKVKIGIYDSVRAGAMVPEFNDFTFGNPVGKKGVVKTDFGYHYIEILAHIGAGSPAYKIAYLTKPIETSPETENNANNEAAKFAGDSRDQKSFDANAEKLLKEKGINKGVAQDIQPSAYMVGALGQSRSLVKKIYDADLGDVLEPEKVGSNWVVAIVTEINENGTMTAAKARLSGVETKLRNRKIAEKLKQKIGNVTTLEAAASALGGKQIETIDSLRMKAPQSNQQANTLASEPKVIGAAFNPANKGKVTLIEGSGAVYVVRLENISATSVANANVAEERKSRIQMGKQRVLYSSPIQTLKESATIKDRRINFF